MPADAPVAPLEYAPGAPVRRRRRVRRIVQLLALLLVGLASWRWGPPAWNQATLLYWQRQCMNFQFPRDVVLYEKDPAKAALLLRQQNPEFIPLPFHGHKQPMVTHAVYQPRCLREFTARTSASSSLGYRSIAFLHERRTPAGRRRLVVVYTSPWGDYGPLWEWELYEPAGVTTRPKLLNSGADPTGLQLGGLYIPRRLGPGQPDPTDPTRFTVPCLMNGQPIAAYDGRLTDDDRVILTQRDGRR